ncbi:Holliday junction resolvase RuvX [Mycoplasma enhydrae]|uniref:Holliday junction resolvase RuvX n=1 Tax=Mycoplasma enhydrae TaxID=2499220 RepID=UPI00197C9B44|nr:Holliday junction resolvase RuvX [Mycoplasma enhydrae]MBN4089205.1 Holliday junction resolvase RuvX [Mycoplasma enhydrae]MCV3733884.1 Holliday junction resolvase RuvX [Mycoplasma enhydrae]MCV3753751.1 Holliday junction resolvase RuvX [Mycoplasma enhydrae]
MRKLALDLGSKTCGFAISDPNNIIASGLEVLRFEEWHFIEVIKRIDYYLNESEFSNQIDGIILGYPLKMDLKPSPRTKMVLKFYERLKAHFNIPIYLQDERETTIMAENILFEAGYDGKKRKTKKDSLSAQLILEDFLKRN